MASPATPSSSWPGRRASAWRQSPQTMKTRGCTWPTETSRRQRRRPSKMWGHARVRAGVRTRRVSYTLLYPHAAHPQAHNALPFTSCSPWISQVGGSVRRFRRRGSCTEGGPKQEAEESQGAAAATAWKQHQQGRRQQQQQQQAAARAAASPDLRPGVAPPPASPPPADRCLRSRSSSTAAATQGWAAWRRASSSGGGCRGWTGWRSCK